MAGQSFAGIGAFSGLHISTDGEIISEDQWNHQRDNWLPNDGDHRFVASLMTRVVEPGKLAGWIAPPARGIDNKPFDFEYIKFS